MITEGDTETGTKAVRVVIAGRVQGVWFRAWTAQEATALGLRGWVRNRRDGSVEAVFAGPAGAVARMLEACWRGPPAAHVTDVRTFPAEAPENAGFRHLPTF